MSNNLFTQKEFIHFIDRSLNLLSSPSLPLSQEHLNLTLAWVLQFQHWQTHFFEIKQAFAHYADQFNFDKEDITHAQILDVEHPSHLTAPLFFPSDLPTRQKGHLLKNGFLFFHHNEQTFTSQLYKKQALLIKGQLYPIGPLHNLTYDPHMNFSQQVRQWVSLPFSQVYFFISKGNEIVHQPIKGAKLEPSPSQTQTLNEIPALFQALKKFEALYINCESDPHLIETLKQLNQAQNWLQLTPEIHLIAEAAQRLQKAQHLYQDVFPQSSALRSAINQLSALLRQHSNSAQQRIPLRPKPFRA